MGDLASLAETRDIAGRPRLMNQIWDSLTELAAGQVEVLEMEELLGSISG